MSRFLGLSVSALLGATFISSCGSTAPSGPTGGTVPDASDQHCVMNGVLTPTHVGICLTGTSDGGAAEDSGAMQPAADIGATLYNSEGYDDDCKYHVSFTTTPIRENVGVTFTVTLTGLDPAGPATGADIFPEVYLTPTQPAPNAPTKTTETPAGSGIYKVGPILFDMPGDWTVRFHFYEICSDDPEDSPHGHAAFFIHVP
jgi:hypothetical protein